MTPETQTVNIVTVPVGLGGKSVPYVTDPAPTVLIDIGTVVDGPSARERLDEATRTADEILRRATAEAEERAESLVAAARDEADRTVADAVTEARAVREDAETDAHRIRTTAAAESEAVARRAAELDSVSAELDRRATQLDASELSLVDRTAALDDREVELDARFEAVDREAVETSHALATARNEADAILLEARQAAEQLAADARPSAGAGENGSDPAHGPSVDHTASRVLELENIHRIEVEVLRGREHDLMSRIDELERRLERRALSPVDPAPAPDLPEDDPWHRPDPEPETHFEPDTVDTVAEIAWRTPDGDDTLLDTRDDDPVAASDEPAEDGTVSTHAPLTEQLSASAFRSQPRRGRRRR